MAPFTPFIAERVWQTVTRNEFKNESKSVHLEKWPIEFNVYQEDSSPVNLDFSDLKKAKNEKDIIKDMRVVRKIVELGMAKRDEHSMKVRQPLASLTVKNLKLNIDNYKKLIIDDVNVKDVIVEAGDGDISVELDIELTPELKAEGIKREMVRFINALRKNAGLSINDKVEIYFEVNDEVQKVIADYKEAIMKETLATDLIEGVDADIKNRKEVKINGEVLVLGIN